VRADAAANAAISVPTQIITTHGFHILAQVYDQAHPRAKRKERDLMIRLRPLNLDNTKVVAVGNRIGGSPAEQTLDGLGNAEHARRSCRAA